MNLLYRNAPKYHNMEVMIGRISEDEKEIVDIILITNKTVDKKSSHNPYMQDDAGFFVQFLIGC